MLQIGVVGLGHIAQKAYLPVMRTIGNVKWYLHTRNPEVLQREAGLFARVIPCQTMEELLAFDLDGVFIHAATQAHFELAQTFLQKGIPVMMDKPLADQLDQVESLMTLAKEQNTILMTGFNRRFAPKIQLMKAVPDKKRIVCEKNCLISTQDTRYRLFDVFIHPLDTALYLMDQRPTTGSYYLKKQEGVIDQVTVYLENTETSALVTWNQHAGSNWEKAEVQSPSGTYLLEQLTDLKIIQGQDQIRDPFSTWDSTLYKRGFESMIQAFLISLQTNGENPVPLDSAYLSHQICEKIASSKASSGFLSFTNSPV